MAVAKKSLVTTEIEMHETCTEKLKACGQFLGRDEIEYADRIRDTQRRAAKNLLGTSSDMVDAMTVTTSSVPEDPGTSVPTPECHADVRGDEISIAMVSAELGIRLGDKAGHVGKKMKALYIARYGAVAAANIPKRATYFRGKPFQENTYYSRDKDLMKQAIREVSK